jgi:hypothetical protein
MRRESPPLLLLVRVEAAGMGGRCYYWSRGGGEEKRFSQRREREGEVVQPPRKVVGVSGCDEGCGGSTVARIMAAEGAAEKEKTEKDGNKGERLVFCQLYT